MEPRRSGRFPVSIGYSRKAGCSDRGRVFFRDQKCRLVFTSKHVVLILRPATRVASCEPFEPMKPSDAEKNPDELVYRVVEVLFERQTKDDEPLRMKEIASLVEKEFGGQVRI